MRPPPEFGKLGASWVVGLKFGKLPENMIFQRPIPLYPYQYSSAREVLLRVKQYTTLTEPCSGQRRRMRTVPTRNSVSHERTALIVRPSSSPDLRALPLPFTVEPFNANGLALHSTYRMGSLAKQLEPLVRGSTAGANSVPQLLTSMPEGHAARERVAHTITTGRPQPSVPSSQGVEYILEHGHRSRKLARIEQNRGRLSRALISSSSWEMAKTAAARRAAREHTATQAAAASVRIKEAEDLLVAQAEAAAEMRVARAKAKAAAAKAERQAQAAAAASRVPAIWPSSANRQHQEQTEVMTGAPQNEAAACAGSAAHSSLPLPAGEAGDGRSECTHGPQQRSKAMRRMRAKSRPCQDLSSAEWTAARERALAGSLPSRLSRLDAARRVAFGNACTAGLAEAEAAQAGATAASARADHLAALACETQAKARLLADSARVAAAAAKEASLASVDAQAAVRTAEATADAARSALAAAAAGVHHGSIRGSSATPFRGLNTSCVGADSSVACCSAALPPPQDEAKPKIVRASAIGLIHKVARLRRGVASTSRASCAENAGERSLRKPSSSAQSPSGDVAQEAAAGYW